MSSHPTQPLGSAARTGFLRATIVVSAFLVAIAFGRHVLATRYAVYDDEGYMLLSFYHYFAGGHLYSEVFSQYGPFNFFAERFLFWLLHLPVTHDAGRLVTLVCWLMSAVFGGYFIFRISKNTILASAAGLCIMQLANVLANEPGHPNQLILPILMLACCASVSRRPVSLLMLGALGAALTFIKINVGIFYFVAIMQTLVCELPAGRIKNLGAGLLLVFACGGPLALMRQDVHGWARNYCLLATVCGISTLVIAYLATPTSPTPLRRVLYVSTGAVSAAALIVGGTIWEGMSVHTLAEGVVWAPLRHPRVFQIPLRLSSKGVFIAMLVSVCIIVLCITRDRWLSRSNWVNGLHCLIGLSVILGLLLPVNHTNALFVALLPIGLIPTQGRFSEPSNFSPRLFVTSLAATQFLQAYPVAGSQLFIAFAPLLLWAFVCVHDGISGLFALEGRVTDEYGPDLRSQQVFFGGLLLIAVAAFIGLRSALHRHISIASSSPQGSTPLPLSKEFLTPASSLRGSGSLHLPKELESRYESLANDIKANCSVLFTMPGMGSLNFWSAVPTPNGLNLTGWTRAFSLEQQRQILRILETNPRSCVVYNQDLVHLWGSTDQDLVEIPLAHYILFDMRKVREVDGYTIFVEPDRDSPWIEVDAPTSP